MLHISSLFLNIEPTRCYVWYQQVDEKTRQSMFKLRQTWTDMFSNKAMYALDIKVQDIDPAWPVVATPPVPEPILPTPATPNIHVNPKFLIKVGFH